MKRIAFFFQHWFGWVCLIFLIRFFLYCFMPEIKSSQEATMEILLSSVLHSQDKEIHSLAFQSLYEIAKKSEKNRNIVESVLKKQLSHAQNLSSEAKEFFSRFQEDPYLILKKVSSQLSTFKIQDLTKLSFFIVLFCSFFLVFALPCFFWGFVGKNSLKKIFGKWGATFFLFFLLLLIVWVLYFSVYHDILWAAHLGMIFALSFMMFSMSKSGIISLFWEGEPKNLKGLLLVFSLAMASTIVPYIVPQEKEDIDQKSLLLAIEKSLQTHRQDMVPILEDILLKSHTLADSIKVALIKALGVMGKEKQLNILFGFASSQDCQIQKAALEAIYQLLKKKEI